MEKGFIFSLIFAAIIALFALSNSEKVLIDFFFTEVQVSQAIVILISTLFGAVIVATSAWVKSLKLKKEIKSLNKIVADKEENNKELRVSMETLEEEKNRLEILVDSLEEDKDKLENVLGSKKEEIKFIQQEIGEENKEINNNN